MKAENSPSHPNDHDSQRTHHNGGPAPHTDRYCTGTDHLNTALPLQDKQSLSVRKAVYPNTEQSKIVKMAKMSKVLS